MSKFKLDAAPTFKAKVSIPVPGGTAEPVEFEFKHYTRDEMVALFSPENPKTDADLILTIVKGWDLDDKLDSDSINKLTQNYQGAAGAITSAFMAELVKARRGN